MEGYFFSYLNNVKGFLPCEGGIRWVLPRKGNIFSQKVSTVCIRQYNIYN